MRVEARERLAVLIPGPTGALPDLGDPAVRRSVVALAGEHGFSHVALELGEASGGVPGDDAVPPADAPLPRH